MTLEEKLDQIKQQGNYAVTCYFGEDVGCDDMDVPMFERRIRVTCYPGGFLGELKKLFRADSLQEFLDMDINTRPTPVDNPPKYEQIENAGIYIWGAEKSVGDYMRRK